MNTSKSLDDIIFSKEYPIKNKHLKDCAFVWQDEGNCNCEQNIPKARAAIVEAVEGLYGDSDCWLWAGAKDNDGYGRFQGEVASRYFYKLWVGEIPEGLVVMHKCDNPPCFNPGHLTLGTVAANNADMVAKKRHLYPNRGKYWQDKTHCKHGHEYTAENTLIRKDGRRYCRECDLTRKRKGLREFASTGSNQVVTYSVACDVLLEYLHQRAKAAVSPSLSDFKDWVFYKATTQLNDLVATDKEARNG